MKRPGTHTQAEPTPRLYAVTVKPRSKQGPRVLATGGNTLTVYLREKPVDGEANQALIKLLAEHFEVAKTCINIKSGARGRRKLVEIYK